MKELIFKKIENSTIFATDYRNFCINNTIQFSDSGMAVVYGPNGTGKTSFINVLAEKDNTSFVAEYDGIQIQDNSSGFFHVILDQNNRHIISGTTKDFFLGDNIQREFELKEYIDEERTRILGVVVNNLKTTFGISSSSSKILNYVQNSDFKKLLTDISNARSKGAKYKTEELINIINALPASVVGEYAEEKLSFVIKDINEKESIIKKIKDIPLDDIVVNTHVHEIEENTEAIKILERFHTKTQCIVCDTLGIDSHHLIEKKNANRENVMQSISDTVRVAIEHVISITGMYDPFEIKNALLEALNTGNASPIIRLREEFETYISIYNTKLIATLQDVVNTSDIANKLSEYNRIIAERPEITEEDMLYIENIISNSMNKSFRIDRDENNTLKIQLSNEDFLNIDRKELPLSTGEQNFLSLTFEFLRAKNSNCKIVVVDDPISSFDSIYKNKIVFAMVRILREKQRIILTHNTDVLRLLDSQYPNCFNLYIMNNKEGESNGFTKLSFKEKNMLINLKNLLEAFRGDVLRHICNVEEFLISLIPFCRGYAGLINETSIENELSQVMHGYKNENVDIADIYITLFGNAHNTLPTSYIVNVSDILRKNVDTLDIVDPVEYPVLNKTLKHSFSYLQLRLWVEKTLVDKKGLNITHHMQLGKIIDLAFPNATDPASIRARVNLTSKKTLINEFNHFEGNLSIFQPAIDITDTALADEKNKILQIIGAVNRGEI